MTVFSKVKGTLASAKMIQAEFGHFAQITTDKTARKIFHECMNEMESIVSDLQNRVEFMKAEEQQYRNS